MGDFGASLVWHRVKRHLPLLRGWPRGLVNMAGPDAQQEINKLRRDYDAYQVLLEDHPEPMEGVRRRSTFETVPVQQVVECCRQAERQPSQALANLAIAKSRIVVGSQVIEDAFKRQTRSVDMKYNRVSRMESLFHVLI